MLETIDLAKIKPGGYQPRAAEDKGHVELLAANMRARGFLVNKSLVVTPKDDGFILVEGHHRYRAAIAAGLSAVPCTVRVNVSERDLLIEACASNDANLKQKPTEQARAYGRLAADGMTVAEIAGAMCKDTGFIERRLALLKLTDTIQQLVDSGNMPLSLAELIAELPDEYHQAKAVGVCKHLELGAARAAVNTMIASSQQVGMFADLELSQEEKDSRQREANAFESRISVLDRAAGAFKNSDLSLALSAIKSPDKSLSHLDQIIKEAERIRAAMLEVQGIRAAGGIVQPLDTADTPSIGVRIRALRTAQVLTVRDLAKITGVDHANISRLERGQIANPKPSTLQRIAAGLGVQPTALVS